MNDSTTNNIIKSYSENTGFVVYSAEELRNIYSSLGIDPKSTHRGIFDLESMSHHLQSEVLKLIKLMNIDTSDLVLEPGCGNGAPSRLIAKTCGCRIIGFDVNPLQVRKAQECNRLEGVDHLIELSVQNVHDVNIPATSVDKIFHNETMCHWADKKRALAGLYKALKKGGIMGFHDWLRGEKGDLNNARGSFPGTYEEGIWFQLNLDDTKQLLEEVGFKLIQYSDTTDIVDRGLRAKLREVKMSKDYYAKSGLQDYYDKSTRYCQTMIETHYVFLKYARFLCIKE